MNIQLKEIILWPQNKELDIKTINFVEGKVNVIHGLSQTGKSAIYHYHLMVVTRLLKKF